MNTRDQLRASKVHGYVKAVQPEQLDDYARFAHKLPVLIRQAGLAQALAFVEARGKEAGRAILQDLEATVRAMKVLPDNQGLLNASRSLPLARYAQLSEEAMASLVWFKRFVQSEHGRDATAGSK